MDQSAPGNDQSDHQDKFRCSDSYRRSDSCRRGDRYRRGDSYRRSDKSRGTAALVVGLSLACFQAAGVLPALADRDHKTLLLAGKYYLINHPDDVRTLASVGSLEIEFGQYDDAIKHLSKAISIQPLEKAHYIDRADAYLHNGSYDKAIADANVVMKSQNGTELGLALANRGEAYYRLKNFKQAISDLSMAIHYLPDLGSTYFYRARAYELTGRADLAAPDYQRARERGFTTEGQAEMAK